ncbi:STAS domain-containing protein [Streptomyces sp. NPDC088762]|uniref:STAS domain-containing protein n=1 Tax=Streptomyces sp. NPDC088762 TaxID=3365891 RepID=UPI0037FB5DF4
MTGPLFQVTTALDADVAALRLAGELDLDTAVRLRAAIAECFARRPPRVLLDLWDLRFCDCGGLNVLLEARSVADRIGTEVRMEGACGQVARLFALTGVDELFSDGVPRLPPRTV